MLPFFFTYFKFLEWSDVIARNALEDLIKDDGVDGSLLHPDAFIEARYHRVQDVSLYFILRVDTHVLSASNTINVHIHIKNRGYVVCNNNSDVTSGIVQYGTVNSSYYNSLQTTD